MMDQRDDNVDVPPIESSTPSANSVKNKHYFDNDRVEALLTEYVKDGCVNVNLRNKIMTHASELIKQVIRTHKLHLIHQGRDKTAFSDLFQIAWCQIESALYKFDHGPGHKKVFNLWSQIARTVILAFIKKESRHRTKAYITSYRRHVLFKAKHKAPDFTRFISEIKETYGINHDYNIIISAIQEIYEIDPKPYDSLVFKLVERTALPKSIIVSFLDSIRSHSSQFSDAPENLSHSYPDIDVDNNNDDFDGYE